MFISDAFAQAAGTPGGENAFMQFLPFIFNHRRILFPDDQATTKTC